MTVTKKQIQDAIVTRLKTLSQLQRVVGAQDAPEGFQEPDMPLAIVYPYSWVNDPGSETGMSTFGGAIQQMDIVFNVDVYCSTRNELGEDLSTYLTVTEAIDTLLQTENQNAGNRLGNQYVRSFNWRAEYKLWQPGGDTGPMYTGAQYTITVRIF